MSGHDLSNSPGPTLKLLIFEYSKAHRSKKVPIGLTALVRSIPNFCDSGIFCEKIQAFKNPPNFKGISHCDYWGLFVTKN